MAEPRDRADDGEEARWFREPTRRERWIAAWLFTGFGLFFGLLFVLERGWPFRWVVLALGGVSLGYAWDHARKARR